MLAHTGQHSQASDQTPSGSAWGRGARSWVPNSQQPQGWALASVKGKPQGRSEGKQEQVGGGPGKEEAAPPSTVMHLKEFLKPTGQFSEGQDERGDVGPTVPRPGSSWSSSRPPWVLAGNAESQAQPRPGTNSAIESP